MAWGSSQRSSGQLKLSDVQPADWTEQAAAIVDGGVLLSLGRSRDGGALSISFVHNGAKGREWYAAAEDFADGMHELAVHLGVLRMPSPAPTEDKPTRGRRRGPQTDA